MLVAASIKFEEISKDEELMNFIQKFEPKTFYNACADFECDEIFVLKTCNRFEIYCRDWQLYSSLILMDENNYLALRFLKKAQLFFGIKVAQHLFKVASGLDSRLLGDYEISGQVRDAAKVSRQYKCLEEGSELSELVIKAQAVSKEVKTKTNICKGFVSYPSVAVNEAKKRFGSLRDKKIVVYGIGKIGKNLVNYLMKYTDANDVVLVNRTVKKSRELSEKHNIGYAKESDLKSVLKDAELLFVATSAPKILITAEQLSKTKIKWIADLSQPGNVDISIAKTGVQLLDIDVLSFAFERNLNDRKKELPAAFLIIQRHLYEMPSDPPSFSPICAYGEFYEDPEKDISKEVMDNFLQELYPMEREENNHVSDFLKAMQNLSTPQNLN